jgi:hypothetical protein
MDIGDFIKIMRSEPGIFEYSYPGDREAYANNLQALRAIWMPSK